MMFRIFLVLMGLATLLPSIEFAFARAPDGYASTLAALYGEHQWVLAVRETCGKMQPKQQSEIESAFGVWRDRHGKILDDLEERVAALVRKASKDQKDYTRNYARSQSEVLKQREEERKQLAALPKEDLQRLCTEFPAYLRDARSDIAQRLPEDFAAIYGKTAP